MISFYYRLTIRFISYVFGFIFIGGLLFSALFLQSLDLALVPYLLTSNLAWTRGPYFLIGLLIMYA